MELKIGDLVYTANGKARVESLFAEQGMVCVRYLKTGFGALLYLEEINPAQTRKDTPCRKRLLQSA